MHPEICPLLLVVFECEGPFGFPSGDPDAGTVEAPLMPTVSEAWNCSLCAQSLWHARVVCRNNAVPCLPHVDTH